jgi:uncharacterized protein (TIGR02453 family)
MDGFPRAVFEWFSGLEADNSKDYFTRTRDFYESSVRGGLEALLDELGGDVWIARQYRDLRFSPDKSPYKTRTYGVAGHLYVSLDASGIYAGTGAYEPPLDRLREAIAADGAGLAGAVASAEAAGLEVAGATLKTAPRGYPRDHEFIDLLRRKQLLLGAPLRAGADGIAGQAALAHCRHVREAAAPALAWLNEHGVA